MTIQGIDDPFRQRRAQEIADKWQQVKVAHERAVKVMWLGAMVAHFDTFELTVLDDMGFLSPVDHDLLKRRVS
jgi:hypothetical protein